MLRRVALKRAAELIASLKNASAGQGCATVAAAGVSAAAQAAAPASRLAGASLASAFTTAAAASAAAAARCSARPAAWSAAACTAAWPSSQSWQAAAASFLRSARQQQQRGFAQHLQFPSRWGGGGWGRSGGWQLDSDKVLWGLVAANGLVFLLWRVNPGAMAKHFTVSAESVKSGRVWTPLTAAFSHADGWHLFANMLGLYFFGRDVGRLFGGKRLLLLYVAGGVAGSLAHVGWYWWKAHEAGRTRFGRQVYASWGPAALGASAAVNAITLVDILLFPTRTILLYGILPMPAAFFGALWLYQDITGTMEGRGHIAHAGHLGGALMGLAFWILFKRGRIRPTGW